MGQNMFGSTVTQLGLCGIPAIPSAAPPVSWERRVKRPAGATAPKYREDLLRRAQTGW